MDISFYDNLIKHIYGGVLAPEEWENALATLTKILGFSQGAILCSLGINEGTSVMCSYNADPDFARHYEEKYCLIDPGKKFVANLRAGEWYFDDRYLLDDFKSHSEFYQDFMRPHGFSSNICAVLCCSQNLLAGLSFQSAKKKHNLDAKMSQDELSVLISHLSNALELRLKYDSLAQVTTLGQTLVDRIRIPVMIVNKKANILYANSSAEAWLGNVRQENSKEAIWSRRKQKVFQAATQIFSEPYTEMTVFKASDSNDAAEYHLVGLPITRSHPIGKLTDEPLGLLLVHRKGYADTMGIKLLGELYGLSPAEQRVVTKWANHSNVRAAAEELHVSIETVRSQLKSVLAKTGCDRQVELARLLSRLSFLM